jgi:hypothetical protein
VKILSVITRLYVHCSAVTLRVLSLIVIPPDDLPNKSRYKIQNLQIIDALPDNTSQYIYICVCVFVCAFVAL